MTSMVAKTVAKKVLGETAKNKFGEQDPYYENAPVTDRNGRPTGKTKRRKKPIPAGISDHDAKVLKKVRRRAYYLDMCLFNFCGIRFGWSSVIGIIPVVGDVLDMSMAALVVRACNQVEGGLPSAVRSKMLFNIVIDFLVGLVPFVGDLADAMFRANTRNAVTLEKYLLQKGQKRLGGNVQQNEEAVVSADPADWDDYMNEEPEPPPRDQTTGLGRSSHTKPTRPQAARLPEDRRGSRGFFGGSRKQQAPDLEMG